MFSAVNVHRWQIKTVHGASSHGVLFGLYVSVYAYSFNALASFSRVIGLSLRAITVEIRSHKVIYEYVYN